MSVTNTCVPREACATVRDVLTLVGDRWSLLIIGFLRDGPRRFSEVHRGITGISQRMLTLKLRRLEQSAETLEGLQDSARNVPDIADRASEETDRALELRTRDRQRKLVSKIDAALRRIDNGEYGYCEMTGEPISLKRLDARPIATMTLEAQEKHERRERVHRDD